MTCRPAALIHLLARMYPEGISTDSSVIVLLAEHVLLAMHLLLANHALLAIHALLTTQYLWSRGYLGCRRPLWPSGTIRSMTCRSVDGKGRVTSMHKCMCTALAPLALLDKGQQPCSQSCAQAQQASLCMQLLRLPCRHCRSSEDSIAQERRGEVRTDDVLCLSA